MQLIHDRVNIIMYASIRNQINTFFKDSKAIITQTNIQNINLIMTYN